LNNYIYNHSFNKNKKVLIRQFKIVVAGGAFLFLSILGLILIMSAGGWSELENVPEIRIFNTTLPWVIIILIFGLVFFVLFIVLLSVFLHIHEKVIFNEGRDNEMLLDDLIHNQPSGIYRIALLSGDVSENSLDSTNKSYNLPVKYLFLNKQHEIITGIASRDLFENPKNIFKSIAHEYRKSFYHEYVKSLKRIVRFHWEGKMMVTGSEKWVRFDALPRLTPHGQVIWTGAVNDITGQKQLEIEMNHREAFERLLTELSSSFVNISVETRDAMIIDALETIGKFCQTDRAYVFLVNHNDKYVTNSHEWVAQGIEPQKDMLAKLPFEVIPQWMKQILDFVPVNIFDVDSLTDEWKDEKRILENQAIKSVVSVPIISNQKLFGFVGFDSVRNYRKWLDPEIQLLRVFAGLLNNALQKVKWEQELTESRRMLRIVLDTIKVRIFWKDDKGVFQGCNAAFAKDAGFKSPDDLVGKTDFDMIWKDQAEKFIADDQRVLQSKKPLLNIIEQQTGPKGKLRWVSTSKIPLLSRSGETIGVLGTYQDITQRLEAENALKKSENRYRILTENAFDGIYLLKKSNFEYVNQRFCKLTGYSFNELTSNEFNVFSLITPESVDRVKERQIARTEGKDLPGTYEIQIVSKSGKKIDVEISTSQLNNAIEDSLILGIMRDITERKNNELLRNQVSVANQSAVFKQNFLANMSHEIRTPLTGVLGMIEVLRDTNLDPTQKDHLNTLKISTENLREIINQILDYSKIEAGEINLKNVVFETRSIFDKARKLYQTTCHKDVELSIEISPNLPEYIDADEQRITQIINNLLSNAIKFTNKGKIIISSSVEKELKDREMVIKICVADTGIGIHKNALSRLFKPFGQIDSEDKRHFDGTGLGLSICKELVSLLGGEIGVESTQEKGSKFWFTFKARKINLAKDQEKAQSQAGNTVLRSLRILYAEDKMINQKVVTLLLQSLGHEVFIANNGSEVLEKFKTGRFDLILMDIQMPVMDGITATHKLRETFDAVPPIVGLSANAFEGDREKYMSQGMDEYLTKPVKADDLKKMISKLNLSVDQQITQTNKKDEENSGNRR